MKAPDFNYHRPTSLDELVSLLASLPDARLLAGGQSLLPMMNYRVAAQLNLIDLEYVQSLSGISCTSDELRIGAMTRQADALASPLVLQHCPLLGKAMRHIGHQQTRNRGTVGGSLCYLDPASEIPLVCATLGARMHLASPRGETCLTFTEFALGAMTTALGEDEVLTCVSLPLHHAGRKYGFSEYARRAGDFAVVGVAIVITMQNGIISDPRIAFSGLGPVATRATSLELAANGQELTKSLSSRLAAQARLLPAESDLHHDADYKRHLAAALLEDALTEISRDV